MPSSHRQIKVWDRFVRTFHWSQAALIVALVLTAHFGKQDIHMFLGFALTALVLARVIWGFVGSEHARFASFVTTPVATLRYLADIVRGHPRRYIGHNPAGAWMVIALLAALSVLLVTGLALQATLEFEGPLVGALANVDDDQVHQLLSIHAIALNLIYLLVPLHLLGVAMASLQHRENLVLSMISGNKTLTSESDA